VMLRFAGGARGALWASQVAPGNENNLRLRVYGSKGGLEWHQEQPNQLRWSPFGQPTQTISRSSGGAGASAARVTRLPAGHPEGYLEAFATLYAEIAQAIRAARPGAPAIDPAVLLPGLADGVRGVEFIEATVASSARGGRWVRLPA
jgi:predicted dehydrogenase